MRVLPFRVGAAVCALAVPALTLAVPYAAAEEEAKTRKVPITTQSEEALKLYLEGRNLQEKLRATDARQVFEKAVAKDDSFALGHLALANTAPSAKAFFASMKRAVTLADKVTEAERHMILGTDAGVRSDPAAQKQHLVKLTAAYPNDERAHNFLGAFHFGRQEYEAAIAEYEKTIAIDPEFSPPYNQMGYAYRFLGQYDEAEKAFKKYIALIPEDPNPYDSYAELLMKTGRFEESIAQYEKALSVNPNFVASYIGIGTNQTLLGKPESARATFAKLGEIARNTGERRAALARTAWSHIDDGAHDKALESVKKMYAIADKDGDGAAMSGDLTFMGNILLEAGRADEAAAQFAKAIEAIGQADVPEEVKEATKRNAHFNKARVALAKQDLETAKAKAEAYAKKVAARKVPFEVWQSHELAGMIALAEKDFAKATTKLQEANLLNPRVLYHLALTYQGKGDAKLAKETCKRAAEFNGLNFNYAYYRGKARKMLAEM